MRRVLDFLGADPAGVERMDLVPFNVHGEPRNAVAKALLDSDVVARLARAVLPLRARVFLGQHVLQEESRPEMDPEAARLLADLYAPEVAELEDRLGRQLPELHVDRYRTGPTDTV